MTDKGCISAEYVLNEKRERENTKKLARISLAAFIIGLAGLIAYIVVGTVFETVRGYSPKWCDAFLVFAVPFVVGLVYLLARRSTLKTVKSNEGLKYTYDFYADCIIQKEIRGGQETAFARIEYPQIVKVREKPDRLCLYYMSIATMLPVDITALTETELNTVKKLLRQPADGETEELAHYGSGAPCPAEITDGEKGDEIITKQVKID